jgi:nucleotidyltransferase/DNA polymerase involved in DNA repair
MCIQACREGRRSLRDSLGRARSLRRTLLQWTGIPVSVGIAPTKILAKVANRFAKKDATAEGVLFLATEPEQEAALARMELTDLWGVAGRLAARMRVIRPAIASRLTERPRAIRTLRGWAIHVLQETGAIHECEEHGWAKDRADPHARERAFEFARREPPPGLSGLEAEAEIRDVLDSIGDTCPECPAE